MFPPASQEIIKHGISLRLIPVEVGNIEKEVSFK
jgi:hypothetical protein